MRLSRGLRPVWSLAALALAISLLAAPTLARAADDDDDEDSGSQGTIRIYSHDSDQDSRDDAKAVAGSGYLGVQVQDVTRSLQRARNLPTEEGALINSVEPDSPADRTGLRRGDVIVEVDGQKVGDSSDLIRVVRGLEPGNRVRITLWRSGSLRTITTPLAERPKTPPPPKTGLPGYSEDEVFSVPVPAPYPGATSDEQVKREIKELQSQVRQLQEELRALRSELRRAYERDRDNSRGDED
jgi:C-terminal processing protease CtpA/Prc